MGLAGNLSAGEIVEQVAYAAQLTKIRNVVFMGMGEPLQNYNAVKVCLGLQNFIFFKPTITIADRLFLHILGQDVLFPLACLESNGIGRCKLLC